MYLRVYPILVPVMKSCRMKIKPSNQKISILQKNTPWILMKKNHIIEEQQAKRESRNQTQPKAKENHS